MDIVLKGKSRLLLSVITAADLGHGDAIAPPELLDRALTDAPEPRSIAPAWTRRPAMSSVEGNAVENLSPFGDWNIVIHPFLVWKDGSHRNISDPYLSDTIRDLKLGLRFYVPGSYTIIHQDLQERLVSTRSGDTVICSQGYFTSTAVGFGVSTPAAGVLSPGRYSFGIINGGLHDIENILWTCPTTVRLNKP